MKNCVLCYLEKDGKYLMLNRNKKRNDINSGKWIGVGGKFENGESPEECLYREVYEETAVQIRIDTDFRETVRYHPQPGVSKEVVYFLTETAQKEIRPREGEIAQVEWVPLEAAESSLTYENDKTVLRAAIKRIHGGKPLTKTR